MCSSAKGPFDVCPHTFRSQGLNSLTAVASYLQIDNNANLASIAGLANLTSVGSSGVESYLYVAFNPSLRSFPGLAGMRRVYGWMFFVRNGANFDYSGLDGLECHGGMRGERFSHPAYGDTAITCPGCPASLLALGPCFYAQDLNIVGDDSAVIGRVGAGWYDEVDAIGRDFNVYDNRGGLTAIDGLNKVDSVGQNFDVNTNSALRSLSGFGNLTAIAGFVSVANHPAMATLTGLSNLVTIGGYMKVSNNPNLRSFPGFGSLRRVTGYLRFFNNAANFDYGGLGSLECHGGIYQNNPEQYCVGCPQAIIDLPRC